jgi:hypothetical protein
MAIKGFVLAGIGGTSTQFMLGGLTPGPPVLTIADLTFPFSHVDIEMCFGGSFRTHYTAAAATAVWPLADLHGDTVTEIIGGRAGIASGVSRGDPGMAPEYGASSGFGGDGDTIEVPHAAAFAPSAAFGIAAIVRPTSLGTVSFVRKENGGSAGRLVLGLKAGSSSAYQDAVIADSPSSYWRFAETSGTSAAPTVGATTGTHTSGPAVNQAGLISSSASRSILYDGSNDYTTFGDVHDFTGTASMSAEFFIKLTGLPAAGTFARMLSKEITDGSGTQGWWTGIDDAGHVVFARRLNGVSQDASSTGTMTVGTTHHVVVTYDGTTSKIYIDAAADGSVASSNSLVNHANPLTLGGRSLISNFVAAYIGELAIYSSVLSAGQISAHYALRTSTGSSTSAYVGANIGGVYREAEYTITDEADWTTNARFLVGRFTGSALQLYECSTDGDVTQLATAAYSGTVGGGTGSSIYFGSNGGASEFLSGYLQWIGWWTDDYPSDAELDLFADALVWKRITRDVDSASGVYAEWGIRDKSPIARTATTGTLQFALKNSTANTAGLLGYYSPDHSNVRSGFRNNIPVRMLVLDPNTGVERKRWVGRLKKVQPVAGQHGRRITECLAVDYIDELARAAVPAIPVVTDEPTWEMVRRILQNIPVKPHDIDANSAGIETFSFGLDQSTGREREVVLRPIDGLMRSELGYLYVRGGIGTGGVLTFTTRSERAEKLTPDWTFSDDMQGLEVSRDPGEVVTHAQVTGHPRTPGAVDTDVLWSAGTVVFVPSGSTVTMAQLHYAGANGEQVGGMDFQPLTAGADYGAYEASDGSGSVDNTGIAFTVASGASKATIAITNTSGVDRYIYGGGGPTTFLQLRGRRLEMLQPVTADVFDEEQQALLGDNVLSLDQPFQSNIARSQQAAQYFLSAFGTERTVARTLLLRVGNGSEAGKITAALSADVGDLVRLTETVTGLGGEDYFVNGVRTRVHGGAIETELLLGATEGTPWLFGVVGRSEYGVTTRMGW